MPEADLPAHRFRLQGDGIRRVRDLDGQIQVLEDPVEQCERALDLDLHVE